MHWRRCVWCGVECLLGPETNPVANWQGEGLNTTFFRNGDAQDSTLLDVLVLVHDTTVMYRIDFMAS